MAAATAVQERAPAGAADAAQSFREGLAFLAGLGLKPAELPLFAYYARQAAAERAHAELDVSIKPALPVPNIPLISVNAPALFAEVGRCGAEESRIAQQAQRFAAAIQPRPEEVDALVARYEASLRTGGEPVADGAAREELFDIPMLLPNSGALFRAAAHRQ